MGLTIGPRPECFTFLCTSHIHARCTGYKGRIQIQYHNMTIYDTKDGIKFIYSNALLSKIQMTLKRETYPISTSYIEIANSLGTDKIQIGLRVLKITKRGP